MSYRLHVRVATSPRAKIHNSDISSRKGWVLKFTLGQPAPFVCMLGSQTQWIAVVSYGGKIEEKGGSIFPTGLKEILLWFRCGVCERIYIYSLSDDVTLQSFLIFNPNLWRASNSLGSGRIAQNRVVNSFSNAGQHIAKAGKLSILNEKSKKQKLGQKMSYSLDI